MNSKHKHKHQKQQSTSNSSDGVACSAPYAVVGTSRDAAALLSQTKTTSCATSPVHLPGAYCLALPCLAFTLLLSDRQPQVEDRIKNNKE
jgi:hypothetical protein